jgi:predicted nicotinamide N-methyase
MKRFCCETAPSSKLPSDGFLEKHAPVGPVPGCSGIVAHQADDIFSLWEAWEAEACGECSIPFWATAWPAATVLSGHLLKNTHLVAGKTVLDLGCGGGVVSIAAARAGAARVIANDIDPVALAVAERNFAANRVTIETCPDNLTAGADGRITDVILVADLFYHRTASESLLSFLHEAHKNGSSVLIADGDRPFTPSTGITVILEETVPVPIELEGVPSRVVRLLALS